MCLNLIWKLLWKIIRTDKSNNNFCLRTLVFLSERSKYWEKHFVIVREAENNVSFLRTRATKDFSPPPLNLVTPWFYLKFFYTVQKSSNNPKNRIQRPFFAASHASYYVRSSFLTTFVPPFLQRSSLLSYYVRSSFLPSIRSSVRSSFLQSIRPSFLTTIVLFFFRPFVPPFLLSSSLLSSIHSSFLPSIHSYFLSY